MSGVKKYFKDEFQLHKLGLDYLKPSDFYLSVWQKNRSAAPLMILRTLLFLTSIGIVTASISIYTVDGLFKFWFIYLTHWGLTLMLLATGFGAALSIRCYIHGPLSTSRLPWFVRTYWVLCNVSVPVAFLITVFYWTVLFEAGIEEERNHGLDIAVHAINTVIMFLLLVTSSQPSRLLHVYQPVSFALVYFLFGLFYHLAGGKNPAGQPFVYPVINWEYPGTTFGIGIATGLLLVVLYFVKVSIATARDAISERCIKPPTMTPEGVPLNRPTHTAV